MEFETLFIIVIILSMFFYYVMTQNCGNTSRSTFSQLKEGFQNEQTDNNNLMNDNNAVLMFFYSKTCSHCINFIPTWEKLKKMKTPGIEFKSIEGDSDDNDNFIKYNIKYLPTIILQFEGMEDFNVYKGDRSIDDIIKFVKSNGINLNTTILEGFENSENSGYNCGDNKDFEFEKGIFKLENDKFILKMKDINDIIIDADIEEDINPVYYLVSKFIDELRKKDTYNMSDEEIGYELNKCNIKKFLKNLEYGLCYNNNIDNLKKLYKNSESDMIKLQLLDKKVCSNDNYIIKKSFDITSIGK